MKETPRDRSAQMKLLGEIIQDIRDWQPSVSFDDYDTQYAF